MIVVTSLHDAGYAALAQGTWYNNKIPYCMRHGYTPVIREKDFTYPLGFEKIKLLLDILEQYPETTWILWSGTDSMITNQAIKVEDKIDTKHSIILSCDFNFHINNDVMLIQNTNVSKQFLQEVLSLFGTYQHHHFQEQQVMLDIMSKYDNHIHVMPQRYMNSYEYTIYRRLPWFKNDSIDMQGTDGQWQPGDWFVHWPGTTMDDRMRLLHHFSSQVVR